MLLSLSVASSIAISIPHYANAQGLLEGLKESKVANQYPEPSQQTQVALILLMPLPQWKAAVMQLMPLLQAMQEQLPAIKLSAAHLPYMVVVEAANRAATFEHIFTESGGYPYFCLLHPNMVGTVSMS